MRGKSWFLGLALCLIGLLAGAQASYGSGFALFEGSARGNALGGTLVGRADDPSALFYNPAGITQLEGFQVMAGATVIVPDTEVVTAGTSTSMVDNTFVVPHMYATYQFSDKVWFGLGSFSRFGLGTEFPFGWPGSGNNIETNVESLSFNPNIAVKLTDKLSAAAGLEVMWFDVDIRRLLPLGGVQDTKFEGDSVGYGFNFALHYRPCKWAAMGLSYRSQVKQKLEGDSLFTPLPGSALFSDAPLTAQTTLPDSVAGGLMIKPMEQLSLEAGFVWTRWSTFRDLTIHTSLNSAPVTLPSAKEWRDVWRLIFGVEYKALDWLDLRAGYMFDEDAVPNATVDYLLPANDRHYFCFGPGFHWGPWGLDLSYVYLHQEDRDVTNSTSGGVILPSRFEDGHSHKIGMSISYKF